MMEEGKEKVRYMSKVQVLRSEACSLNFCDLLFGHEKTLPPASIRVEDFALGGTR